MNQKFGTMESSKLKWKWIVEDDKQKGIYRYDKTKSMGIDKYGTYSKRMHLNWKQIGA